MLASIAVGLAALAARSFAIPTIEAKGAKLFTSDGNQFFNKGVAYQLTNSDPLADGPQCALDVQLMKTLGTNSIRTYHVDPTADHDACMQSLADAGIYAWIDLDTFATYIIAADPQWTQSMFSAYAQVMDTFQKYDNVAGFFVGNEVLNSGPDSIAAPFVKAAIRDMKAYRDSKGYRPIPIGYSAADIPALRPNLQNYLACGSDAADAADFYSLNAYEWCGPATFQTSGYDALLANSSDYNIPIFFSETGCNAVEPRTFTDQSAILGPDMNAVWSGAIIYEWIEETNNFGLISYGPPASPTATAADVVDGFTRAGTPTPIQPGFQNLGSQWATLSPSGVAMAAYTPSNSPPACPSFTSGFWDLSGNVPLPTLGQAVIMSGPGSVAAGSTTAASAGGNAPATTASSGSGAAATSGSSGSGSGSSSGSSGSSSGSAAAAASSSSRAAASSTVSPSPSPSSTRAGATTSASTTTTGSAAQASSSSSGASHSRLTVSQQSPQQLKWTLLGALSFVVGVPLLVCFYWVCFLSVAR